jgi:predicted MFS family arabinose efflux permease
VFFINLPLAVVTLALAIVHVPESRAAASDAPIDWAGGALAILGLAGIAFGTSAASEARWSDPAVYGPLSLGIAVLLLFVWRESRAAAPMVPLTLFRSATFSGANAMTLLLYTAMAGAMFFLPFNLIRLQHYSAAKAGASFLPLGLIMGVLSRYAGAVMDRYGARAPLVIGPAIAAGGLALLALPGIGGSYWLSFFPPLVLLGTGMVIAVAPLTATVMGAVDQRQAGAASGINNAIARIANLLGVALFGALSVGIFKTSLDARVERLSVAPELARAMDAQAARLLEATVPASVTGEMRQSLEAAIDEAFLRAFRLVMLTAAGLALASALTAALTIGEKRGRALRQ